MRLTKPVTRLCFSINPGTTCTLSRNMSSFSCKFVCFKKHNISSRGLVGYRDLRHLSHLYMTPNQYQPQKQLKRKWTNFWRNGVKVDKGNQRRHIVMSKIMKKSIFKMRSWAEENRKIYELMDIYIEFTNDRSFKYLPTINHLDELEKKSFHKLNNMRFNIFIGNGHLNQAINDVANILESTEEDFVRSIYEATSKKDLIQLLKTWIHESLDREVIYKNKNYQKIRFDINENIKLVLVPSKECIADHSLFSLKEDLSERVRCVYDSLSSDLSNASNIELRKWQNAKILPLQGKLQDIIKDPNLSDFKEVLTAFSNLEKEGSLVTGLEKARLDNFSENKSTMDKFTNMITESNST